VSQLSDLAAGGTVRTVRLMACLPDGRLIGKYVSATHLLEMLPTGPNVADIVFGLDVDNDPFVTAWSTWRGELAELYLAPDMATLVVDPRTDGMATVICSFVLPDGSPIPECPRGMAQRLLTQLADRGFTMRAGFEIEFNAFEESVAEARGRGYRDLTPLGGNVRSMYSTTKSLLVVRFMDALTRRLDQLGLHWESWMDEGGTGQFELNLEPDEALRTVDHATLARLAIREVAEEMGHCVTFMAKWHPTEWGGGLHCNHSLWVGDTSAFYDESCDDNRSTTFRHWVGGLMETMAGAQAVFAPNVNSYRRLVELAGSPTTVTWSGDNKTTSLRAMARTPGSARAEHRAPGADSNLYLVMAVVLAGGMAGLDEAIEPPPPCAEMAWGLPAEDPKLPRSLMAATEAFRSDHRLAAGLGAEFVDFWAGTRKWEWLAFHTTGGDPDSPLTDWELNRYFERV